MILADEQLDLAAELVKRAGQLAGDVAAADHGDSLRPLFEVKKAIRADAEFCARAIAGRIGWPPVAITMWRAVNRSPLTSTVWASRKRADAPDVGHALGRQIALVDGVQAQHVGIALVLQHRPVVAGHGATSKP